MGNNEIIVDSFAGGGGASQGIFMALGRHPDVAVNHDPVAVAMHEANHPDTLHLCQNVWQVDPADVVARFQRPIGLLWASPDCKHFSKAKGGKPVEKNIRDLAWVVVVWAKRAKPRVIILENVEEFATWGPLRDDGTPCPNRKGLTFRRWVSELKRLGYQVEWRELRACDYGAPTSRKRLFLIARRDGQPIAWPAPTHGPGLRPYRTAADCIDWSIPCPSIFDRKKPLAEATQRRIFNGIKRYVLESASPFIVPITHTGGDRRAHGIDEPLRTITTAHRGELALVTPFISTYYGAKRQSDARGCALDDLLRTQTTENRHALVSAFLAKHYGGPRNDGIAGSAADQPVGTVTSVDHHSLVTSHLVKLRGTCRDGQVVDAHMPTITAGGLHIGEVRAFLIKYYGSADHGQDLGDPMHTITAKHRMGLVMVAGDEYQIVDVGMRMLSPRELFRAQGFPDSYIIDPVIDGKPISKTAQVRCCGNSVCPPMAAALAHANLGDEVSVVEDAA